MLSALEWLTIEKANVSVKSVNKCKRRRKLLYVVTQNPFFNENLNVSEVKLLIFYGKFGHH